jgi:uncharacterized protein (TIGR02594 family)
MNYLLMSGVVHHLKHFPKSCILIGSLAGCSILSEEHDLSHPDYIKLGAEYIGYSETEHRSDLRNFLKVDPVNTEWCAAYVNAVLRDSDIPGSETVSENPYMARSFMDLGYKVNTPEHGDIVVLKRGEPWEGHVGFYLDLKIIGGDVYYQILGGNQDNSVSIQLFRADRVVAVRRLIL